MKLRNNNKKKSGFVWNLKCNGQKNQVHNFFIFSFLDTFRVSNRAIIFLFAFPYNVVLLM